MDLHKTIFGCVLLLVSGLTMVVAGCSTPAAVEGLKSADIRWYEHTVKLEAGGTYRYERGVVAVPENRSTRSNRTFDLEFHRLPKSSAQENSAPPIFILKGGPGYDGIDEDLTDEGYYEYFFQRYTDIADVVIVGQRGFGPSGELPCPDIPAVTIDEVNTPSKRYERVRKGLAACRSLHEGKGVDLSGFNIVEMANDVADVAQALGYDAIQITGNSFGSHWGMALIREHPELVSRATFSALEGPDHTFDNPREVEAQLKRIASAAQSSPSLASYLGGRDILDEFRELVRKADQEPIAVAYQASEDEPSKTVYLTGADLRLLSRGYSRGTHWRYLMPVWPVDMLSMLSGDMDGAMQRLAGWWLSESLDAAGYYSVECGSGISPARRVKMMEDAKGSLLSVHTLLAGDLCGGWPSDLGEAFRRPLNTDIPALLVQGDWDTSIPLANAPQVRAMFSNHHFVVVHGGSHGALREAEEAFPDFRQAVLAWIRNGETEQLPDSVTLPALKWQIPE
ncbi:MAG: alpha/beta hydrolase [Lysobacterales bacterium]